MGERRIDQIGKLIKKRGGRATVRDLLEQLKKKENNKKLQVQTIYIAIQQENQRFKRLGDSPRFKTSSEGEERGYVSLSNGTITDTEREIQKLIGDANQEVDKKISDWLQSMNWQTFESTFLVRLLNALDFKNVNITEPRKDGGVDATASYQNGNAVSKAIIQAKCWKSGSVGLDQVNRIRGIGAGGPYNKGIIITTAKFSKAAKEEAERQAEGERSVDLIDQDRLIGIIKEKEIGVNKKLLPDLLEFVPPSDTSEVGGGDTKAVPNGRVISGGTTKKIKFVPENGVRKIPKRFRNEMLYELTTKQIAYLSGYAENTVRNYMSTDRQSLGNAIRENPDKREEALKIIAQNRHSGR